MARVKVGDVFYSNSGSEFMVTEVNSQTDVTIVYQDDYNYSAKTTAKSVRSGSLRNPYQPSIYGVGFVGRGRHQSSFSGKPNATYRIWRDILKRCYDEKTRSSAPSYKDCTVADEWHNFQNFAEWYESHDFYGLGYHIDKDLLLEGNRIYHPDFCTLIPRQINTILTDGGASGGIYPVGVVFIEEKQKYCAKISLNGRSTNLGLFLTQEQAHKAYLLRKSRYIRDTASRYYGEIEDKAYMALIHLSYYYERVAKGL